MSVKDYVPVGSISTQLTQQHLRKMRAKKGKGSAPRGKTPDIQQLARQVANQSLGVNRPGRLAGQTLEAAARKAAGKSLKGWR